MPASSQPQGQAHSHRESNSAHHNANADKKLLATLDNVAFNSGAKAIVSGISLQLQANEITTLIGPNGAGKSTIAKLVVGLIEPSSGTRQLNTTRVAYVPQHININPAMPIEVGEFIRLGAKPSKQALAQALAQTGASHLAQAQLQQLSGGEKQRVLIARAILQKPELLVLDEPAQGVDVNGQDELYGLIAQFRAQSGCGVLLISHDLHLVMAESDQVVCVQHHICCQGTPAFVQHDPAFLGIFGDKTVYEPKHIAPYIHHHDHDHSPDGSVAHVHDESCQHNQQSPSNKGEQG